MTFFQRYRGGQRSRGSTPPVMTPLVAALLLIILSAASFWPALQGGFVWDDRYYILENDLLKESGGLAAVWLRPDATLQYYPLVHTSFWIEYRLWGLEPVGYHATNLFLHSLVTILLWMILRRLAIPGAWLAAAIFAVHPVQVETVAWITERKNLLSVFFLFLAILFFPLLAEKKEDRQRTWSWGGDFLCFFFFLLALLAKTTAVILPAVILLLVWYRRGKIPRGVWLRLAPMAVIGAFFASLAIALEKSHAGAEGVEWHFSLIQRVLIASRGVWFYLGKTFWPVKLSFNYPRWEQVDRDLVSWIAFVGIVFLVTVVLRFGNRLGRGPATALFLFLVGHLPTLGFVDFYYMLYSFVADHFQYLPIAAPITFTIAAGTLLARRTALLRWIMTAVGTAILVFFVSLTWRQGTIYRSEETLWRATVASNPSSLLATYNLAHLLESDGRLTEAIDLYTTAARLKPDDPAAKTNLALALGKDGKPEQGIPYLDSVLRDNPLDSQGHYNRATLLAAAGRSGEAVVEYREAIKLNPLSESARNNLATLLDSLGRTEEAVAVYREAVRLNPSNPSPAYNLGGLLAASGRYAEAEEAYLQALSADPHHFQTHNNLGVLLAIQGRMDSAVDHFRTALQFDPAFEEARHNLEKALATLPEEGEPALPSPFSPPEKK